MPPTPPRRSRPIFEEALRILGESSSGTFGPEGFQDYCKRMGLHGVNTAAAISVDLFEELAPELRSAGAMVLRLGSHPPKNGTSFALVKASDLRRDFFLDDALMSRAIPVALAPPSDSRRFAALRMFPAASEYSLLAVGLNTGVFAHALMLEGDGHLHLPISGHFAASFNVCARPGLYFDHLAGQVEVDTTFVAYRKGKPALFVVEAKRGAPRLGLAKHKLVYPMLAIAPKLPSDVAIIPVYIRTWAEPERLHFVVMECSFPDPRERVAAIAELVPVSCTHLVLPV